MNTENTNEAETPEAQRLRRLRIVNRCLRALDQLNKAMKPLVGLWGKPAEFDEDAAERALAALAVATDACAALLKDASEGPLATTEAERRQWLTLAYAALETEAIAEGIYDPDGSLSDAEWLKMDVLEAMCMAVQEVHDLSCDDDNAEYGAFLEPLGAGVAEAMTYLQRRNARPRPSAP